ncbi:MAG: glycosyltransferase family 2 protein [Candidatus Muiribacteriota bacterium]
MVSRKNLTLSVIIPAYKRVLKLSQCISSILRQTVPPLEIIVSDDSDDDSVYKLCQKYSKKVKYIKNKGKGQGQARNTAAETARGDILLFIDSDVILTMNAIKHHILNHKKGYKTVLGRVKFPDRIELTYENSITDLGAYLSSLKTGKYNFIKFITCNLSIRKNIFLKSKGFSPYFTGYGFEDIELGYRIGGNKKFIKFEKKAAAVHYNNRKRTDIYKRAWKVAQTSILFMQLHPEVKNRFLLPLQKTLKLKKEKIPPYSTIKFKKILEIIERNSCRHFIKSYHSHKQLKRIKKTFKRKKIYAPEIVLYELAFFGKFYNLKIPLLPSNLLTKYIVDRKMPLPKPNRYVWINTQNHKTFEYYSPVLSSKLNNKKFLKNFILSCKNYRLEIKTEIIKRIKGLI